MNTSSIIIIVAIALVFVYVFTKFRDDGTVPKAKPATLMAAMERWGVDNPEGNFYIAVQKDTVVAMMAESPDQLVAYRSKIPHEWKLLASDEVIKNAEFSVKGADMKTEYCQWLGSDGKINVICLCYNLLVVFMVVDEHVVEKAN